MKKFEIEESGKKHYSLQVDDVIIMLYLDEENLPESLITKTFTDKNNLFKGEGKKYIEIDEEEYGYLKSKEYILDKNHLDLLPYDCILEDFKKIADEYTKELRNHIDSNYLCSNIKENKEYDISKHKYKQISDYLSERLVIQSCDTCNNEKCVKTEEQKMGLDPNGNPVGKNCRMYKNLLRDAVKIEEE